MNRTQSEPQPTQKYPKGYDQLSDEYKQMWDDIALNHPWFNSKDKPKLSNSNN